MEIDVAAVVDIEPEHEVQGVGVVACDEEAGPLHGEVACEVVLVRRSVIPPVHRVADLRVAAEVQLELVVLRLDEEGVVRVLVEPGGEPEHRGLLRRSGRSLRLRDGRGLPLLALLLRFDLLLELRHSLPERPELLEQFFRCGRLFLGVDQLRHERDGEDQRQQGDVKRCQPLDGWPSHAICHRHLRNPFTRVAGGWTEGSASRIGSLGPQPVEFSSSSPRGREHSDGRQQGQPKQEALFPPDRSPTSSYSVARPMYARPPAASIRAIRVTATPWSGPDSERKSVYRGCCSRGRGWNRSPGSTYVPSGTGARKAWPLRGRWVGR